jgi:hypothetical protein
VMVSRATSLDSLVILTPFSKEVICCRQSQDMRVEFRRVRYLSLKAMQKYGSPDEAARASSVIRESYGPAPADADPPKPTEGGADAATRVDQIQQANAVLMGPVNRCLPLSAPVPGSSAASSTPSSQPAAKCKRRLDDDTPYSRPAPKKRQRNVKP